ncbi:MAG: magnesium transporter [Aerococcus sp.]|nr:magnesium transporter [Aerococcus sp.]
MTDDTRNHFQRDHDLEELTDIEKFENVTKLLTEHNREAFREELMANHTYEQAQIYSHLDAKQRQIANGYLTPDELASIYDVFDEDTFKDTISFLSKMDDRRASAILAEMYRDNAADILQQVKPTKAQIYLRLMPRGQADELKSLMQYEEDTAGSIMTTDFVSLQANQTVKSAMTLVRSKADVAETIYYLYVVDDNDRIVGVVTLRDMMLADANEFVSDIMSERVVAVSVHDDQEIVAKVIRDYDFMAIPVTEDTGQLVGIITVDDILDVIDEEAAEDYSGLAAVDVDEVHESSLKAASGRLPWLITLLFLGMGTATLIGRFEQLIEEVATLSLFITLVTGTAGNAGTQSLAVAVRRLAMPKDENTGFVRMILHEIVIGLISGTVTGITIFLIITVWQRNLALAGVVGIAMLSAITVANVAGSLVPMAMDKLGFDPAVASGPFISTLSDLTSVLIYFSVASQFMPFLV